MATPTSTEQSARFKAVEIPAALPGCCYTCRNHEGPFIDTGISEEMFGVVYLCVNCIAEMARIFGYLTPEDSGLLNAELMSRDSVLEQQDQLIRDLRTQVHGLKLAIHAGVSDSGDSSDGSASEVHDASAEKTGGTVQESNEPVFDITD